MTSNNLPRVANAVVAVGIEARYGVYESVPSRRFARFPLQGFFGHTVPFFLATAAAFFLSQGFGADASEKGNSSANSSVLTLGVNRSFFLALGVMLRLGGTGGFLAGIEDPQARYFVLYPGPS